MKKTEITLVILLVLIVIVGCTKAPKTSKPPEPKHIEWGHPGESPKEVTQHYSWTCFANEYYREMAR